MDAIQQSMLFGFGGTIVGAVSTITAAWMQSKSLQKSATNAEYKRLIEEAIDLLEAYYNLEARYSVALSEAQNEPSITILKKYRTLTEEAGYTRPIANPNEIRRKFLSKL